MQRIVLVWTVLLGLSLTACDKAPAPGAEPAAPGGDRDEFGCIGSAGYQWCAATQSCERPWELAREANFDDTREAFDNYCAVASDPQADAPTRVSS